MMRNWPRLHIGQLGVGSGKIDAEGRALAGSGIHVDGSSRLLNDSVDGRQAEARALALWLGSEKGLEQVLPGLLVHSFTGVRDAEQNQVRFFRVFRAANPVGRN